MNSTIEVSPTATTNCNCKKEWESTCMYGHYNGTNHCQGHTGPGGNNCCFNYWSPDETSPHGVTNFSFPTPPDDSDFLASAFEKYVESLDGGPFVAQISFHGCHIPFIATKEVREACASGQTCKPGKYSDAQLDYYGCLIELDAAVGRVLKFLEDKQYRDNTFIWFTTDNGPEGDCPPEGWCTAEHYDTSPGDAMPLRGRKRDIWEGGHRVPTIISYPPLVKQNHVSWYPVITSDFLPTLMDILNVQRPEEQRDWGMDGMSVVPLLKGETVGDRGLGWIYRNVNYGYRYGKWKYVDTSKSCSNADCEKPLLYDLDTDLAEKHDISHRFPDVFKAIQANFTQWLASVRHSEQVESGCHLKELDWGR